MQPVIILGAGGHAGVLVNLMRLRGEYLLGVTDPSRKEMDGAKIIGTDDIVSEYDQIEVNLVNGIGNKASKSGSGLGLRVKLFKRFADRNYSFPVVRHPSAIIADSSYLQQGVQILAGAIVQNNARILENCIINSRAIVEHDCQVGKHCHIAPGAILCGGVTVGEQVHVGAGAIVLQGIRIGDGAVVAAGAVVTKDVQAGECWHRGKSA